MKTFWLLIIFMSAALACYAYHVPGTGQDSLEYSPQDNGIIEIQDNNIEYFVTRTDPLTITITRPNNWISVNSDDERITISCLNLEGRGEGNIGICHKFGRIIREKLR